VSSRLKRELGLLPLAAIVFFNVSGGPYGIEDMVPAFGPGLTLLLLVLTPLLWSLPVSLVMSELASAMPDEGGYVTWTTRAFGPFWGFQVGWWSWVDSFLDVAVYPALFVEYMGFWYGAMTTPERWLLALGFIVVLTGHNVLGVRPAGRSAVVLAIGALLPVAAMVAVGLATPRGAPWTPFVAEGQSLSAGLGLGLAVVMWNFSGWDTPSTCLGETRAPEHAFRKALLLTLPIIAAGYLLPMGVMLASGGVAWSEWTTGALPRIAEAMGGSGLGHLVAAGAVVSTAGLFLSLLLTNSRLPYVLARDGYMPPALSLVHRRFGTPWVAVTVSSAIYSLFAVFSFKELIVLNIWLYSLSLIVELAAFLWLRRVAPDLPRPWRVPGGWGAATVVAGLPALFVAAAMATAGWMNTGAGVAAALTGPLAWMALRRRRPSGLAASAEASEYSGGREGRL
jgi:amino acid transporter